MRARKGFTLIETCLSLGISILILNLVITVFSLLGRYPDTSPLRQNTIGIIQLRQILSLGRDFKVDVEGLCMDYQTEQTCFHETNGLLIQTPGTQAYLVGIQTAEFKLKDQLISLSYTIDDTEYQVNLIEVIN